jgi:hypothetical protein
MKGYNLVPLSQNGSRGSAFSLAIARLQYIANLATLGCARGSEKEKAAHISGDLSISLLQAV